MLKYILCFPVCLFVITMTSFANLTQQDLNEIRTIVKEEIEKEIMPIKTEVASMKTQINSIKIEMASVKSEIAQVQGKFDRFRNDIMWFIAILAVAGIIPQSLVAWRKRRLRLQEEQMQEKKTQAKHRAEAEKLKQRIVNP
ncbi:hypothetical protein F4212_14685 [Candidatus Poribacteria bacterium]|nr:hypothetical protein [Candidatus Poribacteria bacterium]